MTLHATIDCVISLLDAFRINGKHVLIEMDHIYLTISMEA
jgi:hypothetical protein